MKFNNDNLLEWVASIVLFAITIPIVILIVIAIFKTCNAHEPSTPPVKEIKQSINDSITTIKVKKDEEIKVVLSASNDSTIIIFKQLVNE